MTGTITGWIPVIIVLIALAGVYVPLGNYMAKVFTGPGQSGPGQSGSAHTGFEKLVYRLTGVNPDGQQKWTRYAASVLAFSTISLVFLYLLQRVQQWLPLNHGKEPVKWDQAWNTAVSFTTNTNWQSYSGEVAMSILTQMAGLAVQNFVSAAVGITVAIALIRGLANRLGNGEIGNFWVDLTRAVFRVLLPMAVIGAVLLISQGAIQNFHAPTTVQTITGGQQTIPGGAVASQEVIKELGTNGGGYFNANSAHPYENPNAWTNMLEIFLILVIPVSLTRTFGKMIGDTRQGWAVLAAMAVLYFGSLAVVMSSETSLAAFQGGGMEGKEYRLGVLPSSFFAVTTTMTSTGAVDSFHSSYHPLAGGMLILDMMLGEISPGGVGTGLYGMLMIALLSVFVAGLMVGRTPEYLGKRIGVSEITKVSLYILVMPALVLAGVGVSAMLPSTRDAVSASGPHGFSDLVYAYTSASNNNGSAFAGFGADTPWFNITLGLCMLLGRFLPIIMALALAGDFATQKPAAETAGTLPTHRPQFVGVMVGIAILVGALTFLPTLVLGPLTEALS
ncbi:potassium-transporting ATPase subunit KdpA [Corynebacterium auriscanis]|uniref:potassium-transporting ATPase subunit KdpA n=1 Tax=Corynebacterium auriscanis TaxID=99807 RepID=UPI002246C75C|nr:potassium-transporting ATPase subunit KdpA [Corynebacterium auriscanis]MCX2164176.1 potassium-transporting ATPase subunit KdpA [Corynebacterium auriscanis]